MPALQPIACNRATAAAVQRFVDCKPARLSTLDCPPRQTGERGNARTGPMPFFGQLTIPATGERGVLVANFDIGQSTIKPSLASNPHWQEFVRDVLPRGDWKVIGLTDCQGDDTRNQPLRMARANAVKAALTPAAQPRIVGTEAAPMWGCLNGNDTAADRTLNRSAAIVKVGDIVNMPEQRIEGRRHTHICGPDVTEQVGRAVASANRSFAGWSKSQRTESCEALRSVRYGDCAWDIVELHNNAWILNYRPACASQGASPPCGSTVKVGDDCYYAGSPNYVIFGTMCKLCHDHFRDVGNAGSAPGNTGWMDFTRQSMLDLIDLYKSDSANVSTSKAWSSAGYGGWPSGGTPPPGDRNSCGPVCRTPYTGRDFGVHWYPLLPLETCGR